MIIYLSLLVVVSILLLYIIYKEKEHKETYIYTTKEYFLGTLTIAKNEEMIIDEFVQHNKDQGVNHMYIINNGSTDNMIVVLKPYIDSGFVTIYDLPEQHSQVKHYQNAYDSEVKKKCEWLAVIDVDEYVFGLEEKLSTVLKSSESVDYIKLPWLMFGSHGQVKHPKSIRETFITRKKGTHTLQKSLFRTKFVDKLEIHVHPISDTSARIVDMDNKIRLNHYPIMSWEYFSKVKMTRGDVNTDKNVRDEKYFKSYDEGTTHEDTTLRDISICLYSDKSREKFNDLASPKTIFDSGSLPTELDIVISHYSREIDWVFKLLEGISLTSYRIFLYTKGTDDMSRYIHKIHKLVELENIGRCDHTYVYHIIDNYNNPMSKTTLFLKDSSIITQDAIIDIDRSSDKGSATTLEWLYKNFSKLPILSFTGSIVLEVLDHDNLEDWRIKNYKKSYDQNKNRDMFMTAPKYLVPFKNWTKNVLEEPNFSVSLIKKVAYRAVFFVPSFAFQFQTMEVWLRIGMTLSYGANIETGHFMERLWHYLFTTVKNPEKKLEKIHSGLTFKYGNIIEEYPEQIMSTMYIDSEDVVLEIGANIGRNTLVIASLLTDSSNLVSLETDKKTCVMLEENKKNNNLKFFIENSAISKLPVLCDGWNSIQVDETYNTPLTESQWFANIISFEELEVKYDKKFDTLVADCEGALYYILQDFPKMLNDIKTIIMENDYKDINHKLKVDEILKANQFLRKFVKAGGWGPCSEFFYEVWKKSDSK